jgi:hypothetical protein
MVVQKHLLSHHGKRRWWTSSIGWRRPRPEAARRVRAETVAKFESLFQACAGVRAGARSTETLGSGIGQTTAPASVLVWILVNDLEF